MIVRPGHERRLCHSDALAWDDYLDTIRHRYPYHLPPPAPKGPRPVRSVQVGKKTVRYTLIGRQPYFGPSTHTRNKRKARHTGR